VSERVLRPSNAKRLYTDEKSRELEETERRSGRGKAENWKKQSGGLAEEKQRTGRNRVEEWQRKSREPEETKWRNGRGKAMKWKNEGAVLLLCLTATLHPL